MDYRSEYSGEQIDAAIEKVHNADSTPTAGSEKMVTSGGVKAALNLKTDDNTLKAVAKSGSYNDLSDKPDLSHFITKTVNDLTNYYLKSETYTKAEVQALIAAIHQFRFEVYASLSDVTSPSSNVLYLIGPTGGGTDKYEEYVYTTTFVKIGDTSIDLSGYVTTTALNTALSAYTTTANLTQLLNAKADKDSDAVEGNLSKFDANGNPIDAGYSAMRIYRDLGYNAAQSTITLTAGETGKYVKCSTRQATANANFNISAPFNVDACSELLIKTGYNPSDNTHAPLDISVIAIYEEMERTRVVQKKNSQNQPLYYEVDEDGNPTSNETTEVTDFPVFIQETYTEHRYLPNNEDRFVAIPDSGYYVANIPQSCKCVISYKPGVTDLTVIVVKHGALANLTSQIFGIYEHRTMAEAVTSLALRLAALEARINQPGNITIGMLDATGIKLYNVPLILHADGTPSASLVPKNWPDGLPWDGIPYHKDMIYIDDTAAEHGMWYPTGNTAVSDWKNA